MSTVVPMLPNRLSEREYDAERKRLREVYGDSSAEAVAKRDQALAVLFARSGWTQEQLAEKEGKARSWITRRLLFGRFLNYVPMGTNAETVPSNLTERTFRRYWEQADKAGGNERQSFAAALKLIQAAVKEGPTLPRLRTNIGAQIVEAFGDGKWHDEQEIVDHFADEDPDLIRNRLVRLQDGDLTAGRADREKRGKGWRVRLFKQDRTISTAEINTKLLPLVEGLEQEGRKNMATMSPGTVAHLAAQLRRQIEEWKQ